MLHSDTPLIVEIISEGFAFESKVTPKIFGDFHSAATQILTECFDLVNISRLNENYKMRPL